MSDIETFEVEPEDLAPTKHRRQTKEEAVYGVFYQKEVEEEDGNLQKPVNFTSGQTLQTGNERGETREKGFEEQLQAKDLEGMYGKGFAMLKKAGFKVGQGLGKHEQGAVTPVQIQIRKKNAGLHIEKSQIGSKGAPVQPDQQRWRKGYKRPAVPKDLLDQLLGQYEQEITADEDAIVPESQQILSLTGAVVRYRQEVVETERLIRHNQDVLVSAAYDLLQTQQSITHLHSRLAALSELAQYVTDRLDTAQDLSSLLVFFQSIAERFPTLWQDLDAVRRVAVPMAVKSFGTQWQRWTVVSDYLMLRLEAEEWGKWLGDDAVAIFVEWEKSIQRFIQTRWKAKEETGRLIDALEAWKAVVPIETMSRVKGCLIDVLKLEVERWEPTREKVPIHTWLHPWLPLLDLQELWSPLLQKLGRALQPWQPCDQSAFVVLSPWKPVLGKLWDTFCLRNILPKLAHALSNIQINPQDQEIETFERVMDWAEVLPERHFAEMLRTEFYPRWRTTLEHWLLHVDEAALSEIQTWYEGWQSLVPKNLLDLSQAFHSA
jgi:hypothetical protein